jgi:yeast amino acid transporter
MNGCILLFVISAANSDLYIGSRTLYAMALNGSAPSFIARTDKRGVPYVALGICASFCGLAYMNVTQGSATVFKYLYIISHVASNHSVNLVTIFGLLTWISILVSHIAFIKVHAPNVMLIIVH